MADPAKPVDLAAESPLPPSAVQRTSPELDGVARALGATEEEVRAARAHWPTKEPDLTVWRILACARAGGDEVTDAQLRTVLPAFSLAEIAAARARIEGSIRPAREGGTREELLGDPFLSLDEAVACGLMEDLRQDPACAPSS